MPANSNAATVAEARQFTMNYFLGAHKSIREKVANQIGYSLTDGLVTDSQALELALWDKHSQQISNPSYSADKCPKSEYAFILTTYTHPEYFSKDDLAKVL